MVYMVVTTYRIKRQYRDEFLAAQPKIERAALDLGCLWYECYEDDDVRNRFCEMMAFDSWTHYERVRRIPPTNEITAIFKAMDEWVEGGDSGMLVEHWKSASD
jgi:quinol monooxygenase YgiN